MSYWLVKMRSKFSLLLFLKNYYNKIKTKKIIIIIKSQKILIISIYNLNL